MSERERALAYVRKNLHAWPEEINVVWVDPDGEIRFSEDCDDPWDFYPEDIETFTEWDYHVHPTFTKDEVFPWEDNTGECPYEEGTLIDVEHRDGEVYEGVPALTKDSVAECWEFISHTGDIIKHRLHVPKMEAEKVTESEQIGVWDELSDWPPVSVIGFGEPLKMTPPRAKPDPTAHGIVSAALKHMEDRATTYDKPEGERSMGATVEAFNAVTDGVMDTEEKGWLFMVLLKIVRSQQGDFKLDNYEDGSAYMGLMGEAAAKERSE